jgi:hypothetical protein
MKNPEVLILCSQSTQMLTYWWLIKLTIWQQRSYNNLESEGAKIKVWYPDRFWQPKENFKHIHMDADGKTLILYTCAIESAIDSR